MHIKLNPYLNFNGKAKEAMEFYQSALGGQLTMTTFKDGGMPVDPSEAGNIMHAQLLTDDGLTLMASDTPKEWPLNPGNNVSLSLSGEDDATLKDYWDKLSQGGTIDQPLMAAPWGDTFGMFTDRFGIRWMVNILGKKSA